MKTDKFLGPLKSSKRSYNLELRSISKNIQTPEAKLQNDDMKQPFLKCRHVIAFVGFCYYFFNFNVRMNMSVNIVAMVNQSAVADQAEIKSDSCIPLLANSTQTENLKDKNEDGEFLWSAKVQGYILGSYFLGYVISQIPAGRLVDAYECKWFLLASISLTAVTTFLMPTFAWINAEAVIALQFIRGLAQGVLLPASSVLVCKWFTRSERGQMLGFMKSGLSIGGIVASLLSGFLCESSAKWPSSFYVTGAIGAMISVLVAFCMHESPEVHPRITKAELNFILKDREAKLTKKRPSPPWRKIFTSVPVYAVFYATFGHFFSQAQFSIVHNIFLVTILHYPIAKSTMFTALTYLLQFACILVSSYLSSLMIKKKIASITFTRKFWSFISAFGFSACLLGIYLSGCNRSLSVVFGILSTGFCGAGFAGCLVSIPEMAPTFSGILSGFTMTLGTMSYVILPLIVGYLTDESQTIEQWNKVFFISIGIVMSSGIVFCIFGSSDVQPWNFVKEEKDEENTESKPRF